MAERPFMEVTSDIRIGDDDAAIDAAVPRSRASGRRCRRRGVISAAAGLGLCLGSLTAASAQTATGRITGRVIAEESGAPLSVTQVFLSGTGLGALSDLDGRYTIRNVPPGVYELIVELIGFARKTVTGVEVTADRVVQIDVALPAQAIALDEITVTVEVERGNTARLLSERKRARLVVDAIGSDQISRSPDSDAAAALKRVPGLTVVDEKYVYVRGLGERYGATMLNGAPLPSAEPDRKTAPLDIIPARFLESVATTKTYAPNLPGDYAGGLVQIRTRSFPTFGTLKLSSSFGLNTEASLRHGLGYSGGGLDFFGFDDGTRDLPGILPSERVTSNAMSSADLERLGEAFAGAWGPGARRLPVNQTYGLTLGNEVLFGELPFGFFGSIVHSNSYKHSDDLIERVFASAGGADPAVDYAGVSSTHSVGLGGLFGASLGLGPTDRVSVSTVYNRTVDDEARVLQGFNLDSNTDQRNTRIRYTAQSLFSSHLNGEHRIGWLLGTRIDWRLAYSRASRYEPNTREVLYRQAPDGRFLWDQFVQSGSIFHQNLHEDAFAAAAELELPFRWRQLPASFTLGGGTDVRDRDALARRFRFIAPMGVGSLGDSVRALPPDQLLSPANIAADSFEIQEATFRGDNYDADQRIDAGYAMVDAELVPRLRVVAGARVERAEQTVVPLNRFTSSPDPLPTAELHDTDVLPAVNLTYLLDDDMNLRFGLSRTLARPQFRELAPFGFADYAGSFLVVGNPNLQRTRIRNLDLRWEWFPGPASVVAISGFYKAFDDPIEALVVPSTELIRSWVNARAATNYGAEVELRAPLGFVAGGLENVLLNANMTVVESEVETGTEATIFAGDQLASLAMIDRSRPLQGQSPYVVNLSLTYLASSFGASATVLYNRFGRRIDAVGQLALPDIYEEARDQLDVVLQKQLFRSFELKFTASRILGNEYEFTQGGDVLRSFDVGRSFSLSFAWEPTGQ